MIFSFFFLTQFIRVVFIHPRIYSLTLYYSNKRHQHQWHQKNRFSIQSIDRIYVRYAHWDCYDILPSPFQAYFVKKIIFIRVFSLLCQRARDFRIHYMIFLQQNKKRNFWSMHTFLLLLFSFVIFRCSDRITKMKEK